MTLRPARPGEEAELDAFLARHAASSMFLRGNLATHGLAGPPHPHRTAVWRWPAKGPVRAVFGRTRAGMLLLQAPDAPGAIRAFAALLAGQEIAGVTGAAGQVDALVGALRLPDAALRANLHEPLMHLDLARLPAPPAGALVLRAPVAADAVLLQDWFAQYFRDTGIAPSDPALAAEMAADRARAAIEGPDVALLLGPDGPCAMAALNARAADMVQVGGVYVPGPLRGRGSGREVTRALLDRARGGGVRQAVLFANNAAAEKAYRGIGFVRVGWYRIALTQAPWRAGETKR